MTVSFFLSRSQAFFKDRNGSVAIVFGLAVVPLVLVAAGATDYSRLARERAAIGHAADAAILAALKSARTMIQQGNGSWQSVAQQHGALVFAANANGGGLKGVNGQNATVTITLSGSTLTGRLSYDVNAPTNLLQLAGISTIPIRGSSQSTVSLAKYTDIHIVVDASPSMGIGATATDEQTMRAAIGCEVACHYSIGGLVDNLAASRATGATLRIDVVKQALAAALAKIPNNGMTRIAIYSYSNTLKTVFPLSSNVPGAVAAANALELTGEANQGGTNTAHALGQLTNMLGTPGSGLTPSTPSGVVMLATDAVEDDQILPYADGVAPPLTWGTDPNFVRTGVYHTDHWNVTLKALDPASCAPIKAKGYTMMTLETKYIIPVGAESGYHERLDFIEHTLAPLISSGMADCATSTANYYQANSSSEIATAIEDMMGATTNLKLTH